MGKKKWGISDGNVTCARCKRAIAKGRKWYRDGRRYYHKSHTNWVTRVVSGGLPTLGKRR